LGIGHLLVIGPWSLLIARFGFRHSFGFPVSDFGFLTMPQIDFFNFFRIGLAWVVTIYATIITLQSLWGWYVWLAGSDKYISLVRRYIILQGLRLRVKSFGGDVLICILLTVAFLILWHAHFVIEDLQRRVSAASTAASTTNVSSITQSR
jgi:hypothetical protein